MTQNSICVRDDLENKFASVKDLELQGLSSTSIAQNLGISRETLRRIKTVKELIKIDPLLSEFIYGRKLSITTAVNSYQQFGAKFIQNLENLYEFSVDQELPLTPSLIHAYFLLSKTRNNDQDYADTVNSYTASQEYAQKNVRYNLDSNNNQTSREELKDTWDCLQPQINMAAQTVDLNLSLDDFNKINYLIKDI